MESKIRQSYRPRGNRWLVNVDQHKVVEFQPEEPTADGQWVTLRTFHWCPPDYPIPETRRRMARHKAIEAWETMVSKECQHLRDALHPTGNARLTASGRGRSGALKVFSAKTSTKSTSR